MATLLTGLKGLKKKNPFEELNLNIVLSFATTTNVWNIINIVYELNEKSSINYLLLLIYFPTCWIQIPQFCTQLINFY